MQEDIPPTNRERIDSDPDSDSDSEKKETRRIEPPPTTPPLGQYRSDHASPYRYIDRPTQRRQCARQVAGGPRRPDAELIPNLIRLLMPRPEVTAHPATAKRKAGGPRRADAELIPNLIRLLMPHPEVASHPATAMRKAGGPRRPDAEQSRQVTRCSCRQILSGCSCRTRRSRPTQRRQSARQGPRRPDAEQSRQVTRCSCRARRSRPTRAGARGLLSRPHPLLPNSQTDNDNAHSKRGFDIGLSH